MKPKLYGDGEHDDQPALQAVVNGEPIEIMNDCAHWEGSALKLHAGTICRIARPIITPSAVKLRRITGAMIQSSCG